MRTIKLKNKLETLKRHLDHDYYQYNKNSSTLEDPTCDNYNFSYLVWVRFSPTAGIIFETQRSYWYQIEATDGGKFSRRKNCHFATLVNIHL